MIWHNPRLLNLMTHLLIGLTLVSLVAAASQWLINRPQFSIWFVEVGGKEAPGGAESLKRVKQVTLRQVDSRLLKGSFFTVDLQQVRAEFSRLPWVRQVYVRRQWPNRLVVELEEHEALGLWGDNHLVNTFGEVFVANLAEAEAEGKLPRFQGPPGSEALVAQRWKEMNSWLEPSALRLTSLNLSSRYAWSAQAANGTTLLLGREQNGEHKDRVVRMLDVLPQVSEKLGDRPSQIDLRYPNGFAVKAGPQIAAWEQEQAAIKAKQQALAKPVAQPATIDLKAKETVKVQKIQNGGDRG